MRKEIKEKLANLEFDEGVGKIQITVDEALRIQQMMFDMDDLKEKMTKLTLMIEERCNEKEDKEIYDLSKEIYIQHLLEYEEEEYEEEYETKGEKDGETIL